MNQDFSPEYLALSTKIRELQATVLFLRARSDVNHGLLLGLLKEATQPPEAMARLQENIAQLVRQKVEGYLAKISDDDPTLASRLKQIVDDAYAHNSRPELL